jgi:putative transposase
MPGTRHRLCPTDLTDAGWAPLEPLLEGRGNRGRPPKRPRRLIADAILYLLRSGCPWRLPPREHPPWRSVYTQFRRRRLAGALHAAHDRLRERVRLAQGRDPEPSAAVLDGQTARGAGVGGPARGYDGAERANGRKRHLPVDTLGLVLLAHVHAAGVPDRAGARALLATAGPDAPPRLEPVRADAAYAGAFADRLRAGRGWRLEVPRHPDRQLWRHGLEEKPRRGFRVPPRRRVVERTFAWLGQSRRLARDYEHLPRTGEAMIHAATSRIMPRRLARTTA